MIHQDWNTQIVNGKMHDASKKASSVKKTIVTSHINKQETNLTVKKIYDLENPNAEPEIRPVMIDKEFAKNMMAARVAKKMTQKQLAGACALDVSIINQYEQCKAVRNGQYITKIKKVLGSF